MFRIVVIAACLMAAASAEAANRVVVRRGPLGLRREVVVQRPVRQQIVVPRHSAIVAPQAIVVPGVIHQPQQLLIIR